MYLTSTIVPAFIPGAASKTQKGKARNVDSIRNKPGPMSDEHAQMIEAEVERRTAFVASMAEQTQKPIATISAMLDCGHIYQQRAKNPWSVYQAWYAAHHPKGDKGMS
jgi:hypothetical protein